MSLITDGFCVGQLFIAKVRCSTLPSPLTGVRGFIFSLHQAGIGGEKLNERERKNCLLSHLISLEDCFPRFKFDSKNHSCFDPRSEQSSF